jgi:hypothetical protein
MDGRYDVDESLLQRVLRILREAYFDFWDEVYLRFGDSNWFLDGSSSDEAVTSVSGKFLLIYI